MPQAEILLEPSYDFPGLRACPEQTLLLASVLNPPGVFPVFASMLSRYAWNVMVAAILRRVGCAVQER
jgi:hypothetical protein